MSFFLDFYLTGFISEYETNWYSLIVGDDKPWFVTLPAGGNVYWFEIISESSYERSSCIYT